MESLKRENTLPSVRVPSGNWSVEPRSGADSHWLSVPPPGSAWLVFSVSTKTGQLQGCTHGGKEGGKRAGCEVKSEQSARCEHIFFLLLLVSLVFPLTCCLVAAKAVVFSTTGTVPLTHNDRCLHAVERVALASLALLLMRRDATTASFRSHVPSVCVSPDCFLHSGQCTRVSTRTHPFLT